GYVLLIVIATSILVVTVLSGLAKQSLSRGLQAADAERTLQQRWGSRTIEQALLSEASKTFELRAEIAKELTPKQPPPPVIRTKLVLGDVTFDVLLGDEDSKLSLNTLYHHAGPEKATKAIGQVAGRQVQQASRLIPAVRPKMIPRENLQLIADDAEEDEQAVPDAFRSWGEVFDIAALNATLGNQAALPAATKELTCWGSGPLNFGRASDEAILAVTSSVVQDGGGRRLLQKYRDNPTATLSVLLQTEVSNPRNRERLQKLLSETSTNFSIWIDASSKTGRSMRTFAAMRRDDEGVTQDCRFSF
ncbi:MAG: hypothetical protein ACR2NZ_20990, partial [Rubripirellula sp.]